MRTIIVTNPKNDTLIQQLVALYLVFKNITAGERVIFDLSQLNWLFPLIILPISAYIRETKSEFIRPTNPKVLTYLEAVHFPKGVSSVSEFQKVSSYIPIGVLARGDASYEKIESCFAEMVYKVLRPTDGARSAIYYPLTELVTNIFEHSKKDIGYIFGQYYPKKEFLDLCIVDCGRGLACSYKEESDLDLTDAEALRQVLMGKTTKPDKERGYGVRTSKEVVCKALNGSFCLLSGGVSLYSSKNENKSVSSPGFNWRGVVIAYRIPRPKKSIDITPFLE